MKLLNAYRLKLIMAFLMLLNHIEYIQGFIPPDVAFVFTIASRCVAPVFAFLVVEGILHTSDLKKYCLRLFAFAGIMFAGNLIINFIFDSFASPAGETGALHPDNNIMITLALGALGISLIKHGKEQGKYLWFFPSGLCLLTGFILEWGTVVIPLMVLTYLTADVKNGKLIITYIGYAAIEVLALLVPWGEPFWFIALPFIWMYNGERGRKTKFSKYFFYIFYPAHLWLIAAVNFLVIYR